MIHILRRIIIASMALALFLPVQCLAATSSSLSTNSQDPKVILIIADYLTLSDFLASGQPGIAKLVKNGGIGVISPGAAGGGAIDPQYATISAGASSWGNSAIYQAYSATECIKTEPDAAKSIHKRRTGSDENPGVVQIALGSLIRLNEERPSAAAPAMLGETLSRVGKKTALFGNSDVMDRRIRRGSIIASSQSGVIHTGDVSINDLNKVRFSPTGFMLNSTKLANDVNVSLADVDFAVVDFGDVARVELFKQRLTPQAYKAHRENAIKNLDRFISNLTAGAAGKATIMLASIATPVRERKDPKHLASLIIYKNGQPQGAIISPTTRTPGLVAAVDVAPTILKELGVNKPGQMIGSAMTTAPGKSSEAVRVDNLVQLNSEALWPVLCLIGGLGIFATTVTGITIAFGKRGRWIAFVKALLVYALSSPLAMVFSTPGTPLLGPYITRLLLWMAGITITVFLISYIVSTLFHNCLRKLPGALPIVVLSILTSLVILAEAFTSGGSIRYTLLNAACFEGYRFYGIGNEYMGVWLATTLIAIIWLGECFPGWEKRIWPKILMLLISLITVVAMGYPRFGTNAGGTIAAVVGLGLVYIAGTKKRFSLRHVVFFGLVSIATVAAISVFDMMISRGAPSHIGLAASMSERQGYSYIITLALRKVLMNFRLIGTIQAQVAIVGSLPLAWLWMTRVSRKVSSVATNRPQLRWGMIATLICAAAAFAFNDSGVVAAGLIVGYLAAAIAYSTLSVKETIL